MNAEVPGCAGVDGATTGLRLAVLPSTAVSGALEVTATGSNSAVAAAAGEGLQVADDRGDMLAFFGGIASTEAAGE